jgi:hypothetical protein
MFNLQFKDMYSAGELLGELLRSEAEYLHENYYKEYGRPQLLGIPLEVF